jgi:hypothetical protein
LLLLDTKPVLSLRLEENNGGNASLRQFFRFGPMDPHGFWSAGAGSGFGGQKDPQNKTKLRNFSFEVLDVLSLGLKASPVAWTFFMEAY